MKKRIVCILLAAVMTVMLAACGKSDASGSGNMAASEEASQGTESEGSDQENAGTENDEAEDSVAVNAGSESSTVYFTTDISPAGLMNVYEALGWEPTGKVAAKLSTGEPPASNYLDPALIADLVQSVDATIVECNTLRRVKNRDGHAHAGGRGSRIYGYCGCGYPGCGRLHGASRGRRTAADK